MTVVRLPSSKLLLHSPIACSRELSERVAALGSPEFLIAPNRFHHIYVQDWQAAYPHCRLHVAPGLEQKRPDLAVTGVLDEHPLPDWSDVVDQALVKGFPLSNEVVFFHKPSRTLIASDLAFNVGSTSPAITRLAFRMAGAYGRLSTTLLERLLVRDRAAFRRSLERILRWPISRVIVAHGTVLEIGGQEALAKAYDWVLGTGGKPAV